MRTRDFGGRFPALLGCLALALALLGCEGLSGQDAVVSPDTPAAVEDGAALDAPPGLRDAAADGRDGGDLPGPTDGKTATDGARPDAGAGCPSGQAPLGCACADDTDCRSGRCALHGGAGVCTETCAGDCPDGWDCRALASEPGLSVCVSRTARLCWPCEDDGDCAEDGDEGATCVDYGESEGRFCGVPCDVTRPCPTGFDCQAVDGRAPTAGGVCVANARTCPCTAAAAALAGRTPCRRRNADGACAGFRRCVDAPLGLSDCDAPEPTAEVCGNGLDDDCDGVTDPPDRCAPCACGDGVCETERCGERWDEEGRTCAADCAVCGDHACDPGESATSCPMDCCGYCGDGDCRGGPCGEDVTVCPGDCGGAVCGNDECEPGEDPVSCPADCQRYACGNDECEPGEDPVSCPLDCATACGDCVCEGDESYLTCPVDCGFCGDGFCISGCPDLLAEDAETCAIDCCTPDCDGKECGDSGCGWPCGTCPASDPCRSSCVEGRCERSEVEEIRCNDVDDDCNGLTDEGYDFVDPVSGAVRDKGDPCGVGVCADGAVVCAEDGSRLVCSTDTLAGGETCDGRDDDCDGRTDGDDPNDLVSAAPHVCERQAGVCEGATAPPTRCVDGAWLACDDAAYAGFAEAYQAGAETACDGLDNDCDGATDEDFPLALRDGRIAATPGVPCGVGPCAGGTVVCDEAGTGLVCPTEALARVERCNGVDDDCDGAVDNEDPAALAAGDPRPCERSLGVCAGAMKPVYLCQGGSWATCGHAVYSAHAGAYEPDAEVSCDGLDNDCDGGVDEDFARDLPDGSRVTGVGTPCGVGACAGGTTGCRPDGLGIACSTEAAATAEVCNGADDDCDGLTDDGGPDGLLAEDRPPCEQQAGVCAGTPKPASLCVAGAWRPCTADTYAAWSPAFEAGRESLCDGLDNDCDGLTDEDFTLTLLDGAILTAPGLPCGSGRCAGGRTRCTADGAALECPLEVQALPELCNLRDDDCDGATDEGLAWSDPVTGADRVYGDPCGTGSCAGGVVVCAPDGAGLVCSTDGALGGELCDGVDNDCDGATDFDDADSLALADPRPCELQAGICQGAQHPLHACRDGAWLPCKQDDYIAVDPRYAEGGERACDDVDDDCDGAVDEDFPLLLRDGRTVYGPGVPCGVGACAGGTTTCRFDGTGIECAGEQAAALEICNGVDDDCDGGADATDDEALATGFLSHDVQPCERQIGVCAGAVKPAGLCQGGTWQACGAAAYLSHHPGYERYRETLCDGLDNDCDGLVDEDFVLSLPDGRVVQGAGRPCGEGACAGGTTVCRPDGAGITCDSLIAMGPELCNGVDDDCDGRVDAEDPADLASGDPTACEVQDGVCAGARKPAPLCVAGEWRPCRRADYESHDAAYREDREFACDGIDEDCDGATDDDFVLDLPDGTRASGVGAPCGVGACADGETRCAPSRLGTECSTAALAAGETCNGVDDDCDGLTDAADPADLLAVDAQPCEERRGVCAMAVKPPALCAGGDGWEPCRPEDYRSATEAFTQGVELSCDGLDNDCDGETDEDFPLVGPDGTEYRAAGVPCGTGRCSGSITRCSDDGTRLTCGGFGLALAETCNGEDDDCDGLTDAADPVDLLDNDGRLCLRQAGVCHGAVRPASLCLDGAWSACGPDVFAAWSAAFEDGRETRCDDLDNDCDGLTDEDFLLEQPDGSRVAGVGSPCGRGACAGGVTGCAPDGAAIVCSTSGNATPEVCNGFDDDCDGGADAADPDDVVDGVLRFDAPACEVTAGVCAAARKRASRCWDAVWHPCVDDDYSFASPAYERGGEVHCDGLDNDCDGLTDDDFDVLQLDGIRVFGAGTPCGVGRCAGGVTTCDEAGEGIVCPGEASATAEGCDGQDDDCDGLTDADDDSLVAIPCELQAGPCAGAMRPPRLCTGGEWSPCDASLYFAHDGRYEDGKERTCEGLDNDCDGATDDDCDVDGDGWCATGTVVVDPAVCPFGGGDCDDLDPDVHPEATERCNGVDDDCSGAVDDGCDGDGDDWCDAGRVTVGHPDVCPFGGGDCDDTDSGVHPEATERCNGIDDNCVAATDEGCDDDDDGWCDAAMVVEGLPLVCPAGGGDCNDEEAGDHPAATERCDDRDNDCSGTTDEGCDDDDDGWCDGAMTVDGAPATCPNGGGDCDDGKVNVHPGLSEQCDDLDNDCSGAADEGCDDDNDDWCDSALVTVGRPSTCTHGGGDCNDGAASVNPAATERCDDINNDCDGSVDEGCDDDNDNYCDANMTVVGRPTTCTAGGGDCNDGSSSIHPGATERCDNVNNDCDGSVDEGCDDDNDNYCDAGMTIVGTPSTCTAGGGDCCDSDSRARPGQSAFYTSTNNCGSWDYNCNGSVQKFNTEISNFCTNTGSPPFLWCLLEGWVGSVPGCGGRGTYRLCSANVANYQCVSSTSSKTQGCH